MSTHALSFAATSLIDVQDHPWQTREAAALYDRIYSDADDVGLFLQLAATSGGPILEIGCGTGRCLIPFIRAGFDTVGIDRSEPMLDILRKKLKGEAPDIMHRATPLSEDGRNFMIPLRFGMVFVAGNALCHFLTKNEQETAALNVFQHLRPGALFVIDILNPRLERFRDSTLVILESGDITMRDEIVAFDQAEQTVTIETIIRRGRKQVVRARWPLRYLHRFELELLLEKTGFEILNVWGDYQRSEFRDGAERLIVVARKPPDADMTLVQFMRTAVAEPVG